MKDTKIYRLTFFVNCKGWAEGGYQNSIFVFSKKEGKEWLKKNPDCDFISLKEITKKEFTEDYIGGF